jgi:hypothetical protein
MEIWLCPHERSQIGEVSRRSSMYTIIVESLVELHTRGEGWHIQAGKEGSFEHNLESRAVLLHLLYNERSS